MSTTQELIQVEPAVDAAPSTPVKASAGDPVAPDAPPRLKRKASGSPDVDAETQSSVAKRKLEFASKSVLTAADVLAEFEWVAATLRDALANTDPVEGTHRVKAESDDDEPVALDQSEPAPAVAAEVASQAE